MDISRRAQNAPVQPFGDAGVAPRRQTTSRKALPFFAFIASMCFVLVAITDPTAALAIAADTDDSVTVAPGSEGQTQTLVVAGAPSAAQARDRFTIIAPPPPPPPVAKAPAGAKGGGAAPAAGTPDPGSAKAIAYDMVMARGWGEGEYNCLVSLWNKESGWNVYANNKSSGAYGIPQALPGSKMATAGADWATNAATQITWGLGYITGRYSTPCGAWGASQSKGWY